MTALYSQSISCTEHCEQQSLDWRLLKFKGWVKYSGLSGLELLTMMNEPAIKRRRPLYSKVQQQQQQHRRIHMGEEKGVTAKFECQLSVLASLLNLKIKQRK